MINPPRFLFYEFYKNLPSEDVVSLTIIILPEMAVALPPWLPFNLSTDGCWLFKNKKFKIMC
jgi:hypothetical protein